MPLERGHDRGGIPPDRPPAVEQGGARSRTVLLYRHARFLSLAERLNQAATRLGRRLAVLIEIKLSHEPSKAGVLPDSEELRVLLEGCPDLTALELRGLMTVPPYLKDLAAVRPYFAQLRKLRDQLAAEHPRLSFAELSMGMSHDFPAAIAEGATQVRIGTALFGARKYPK